ncbi:hypothetical protein [Rhodococcus sp. BH5]|uniref:hypothetical protein n=1 Tax=Rhodococcus sp. BH5 TaxID=2871702 RepID=UPI0022CD62AD|nr:hypothetical protein [Rhodococcus sp. BH5]MCZ9635326.1 hypothetical protein [Rhodococcus sp. BH5]
MDEERDTSRMGWIGHLVMGVAFIAVGIGYLPSAPLPLCIGLFVVGTYIAAKPWLKPWIAKWRTNSAAKR